MTTRVGIVSRTATYEPLYVLEREGTATLVELGSTAAGVDALLARDVDIAATCPDALIASGAPLRIAGGLVDRPPTRVVASAGIRDVAELRGRRVGTTSARGSVSIFLRALLRERGLARGDYVEVVCGPTPAQAAALERREIDAAMLTLPFDERPARLGFARLADVGAELGPCAFTTLNVREGWTASAAWRGLRERLATAMASVGGPVAYDLRVDPAGIDRLLGLMREEGLPVPDGIRDRLIDAGAQTR